MKTRKHTIPYTLSVELELEIEVTGSITPGDPGCRYTRNGDGWPPSPPEVDIDRVKLVTTVAEIEQQAYDLLDHGERNMDAVCDLLKKESDDADEAAKEASYEARAEIRRERMEDR